MTDRPDREQLADALRRVEDDTVCTDDLHRILATEVRALHRLDGPTGQRWAPRDEAEFDRVCTHCGQRVRDGANGNVQAYNGSYVCWAGRYPTRADLDRRHIPAADDPT